VPVSRVRPLRRWSSQVAFAVARALPALAQAWLTLSRVLPALVVALALGHAAAARAQEPLAPSPPPLAPSPPPLAPSPPALAPSSPPPAPSLSPSGGGAPCCVAVPCCAPAATEPRPLLLAITLGPTYRRAFKEDFAAAAAELEIGGQGRWFSVGARFDVAAGGTRVGLPFQTFTVGPGFRFPVGDRLRLGFGMTFGALVIQRVSATAASDPTMWSLMWGSYVDGTVDVVRTRGGSALFVAARVGYDFIDNFPGADLGTGSSLALTAALGYRL
jgi:hypothetical protein